MLRSVASLAVFLSAALGAQPALAPRFEVASVKPSSAGPSDPSSGGRTTRGRLTMTNVTLKRCIMGAYGVGPNRIFGGPDWLDSGRFEIFAKAAQPIDDDAVLMTMLRTLLAERFQLRIHRETRLVQAYLLEVASKGPKLRAAETLESATRNAPGLIDATTITMDRFAEVLSRQTDLPVLNRTGLQGAFDLKLQWTPDSAAATDTGPPIFTAIQQQLGLRLRSRKTPVEVLVIDHAEKPSEN